MSLFRKFFQHNWPMIFYLNFKCLPFSQAIKLPIDVYRKIRIISLKGNISIHSEKVYRGMIKLGAQNSEMFAISPCILNICGGVMVFEGSTSIGVGCYLRVTNGAELVFGDHTSIGSYTKSICYKHI